MSNVEVFKFEEFNVRTMIVNNEPWWVAKDIADVLGYSDTATMTRRLDEDEKGMQELQTLGGMQKLSIINESGLYNAILGSTKLNAKIFKKWITSEVLPAIRKTGGYLTDKAVADLMQNPFDKIIEIATECKALAAKNKILTEKIDNDAPKVSFADTCMKSNSLVSIGQLAKLASDEGISIGRNRLFDKLRDWKMIMSASEPYQSYIDNGCFKVIECEKEGKLFMAIRVTPKGQMHVINKLKQERNHQVEFILD